MAGLCLGALLLAAGGCAGDGPQTSAPLYCYVGGTMRPAMEELIGLYEKETGRRVELDYGDSGSNLVKAEVTRRGDLYVAHDPFHGAAVRKGLSADAWAVAGLKPMIAVAKGNPERLAGLKDLARPGVRVILTDADYSTVGHVNRLMFRKAGLEADIEKNVVTRTKMGGEAANAVILGHADAAIVWNAVIHLRREKLDAVDIEPAWRPQPQADAVTSATFGPIDMSRILVTIDVLKSSAQAEAARAFAEFAASDRAAEVWARHGFDPAPAQRHLGAGEAAGAPAGAKSILVYIGAGLRPALEDIAAAFTARTGIAVERDYGGSGMIISRLRLAKRGDLFMPGDVWYVDLAEQDGLVASKDMVCYFVPVILVQKGNPKQIGTLADLARPGVRLGLGNPKACQVGRVCEQLWPKNGIDPAAIEKNLEFSSVTVNELGVQIKAGALDAVIVWDAVAAQYPDSAEVVAIPPEQNIVSHVAVAVLKCSEQPEAARQFVEFLRGDEGQALFRKHQYRTQPPA